MCAWEDRTAEARQQGLRETAQFLALGMLIISLHKPQNKLL